MKIRVKANSLRYRLTRSEVAQLHSEGYLQEVTELIPQSFIYAVQVTSGNTVSAEYTANQIILKLPRQMIDELALTDTVGFDGQSGKVHLLIEKDFVCIDNTTEDQSDNYPNPSLNCQ